MEPEQKGKSTRKTGVQKAGVRVMVRVRPFRDRELAGLPPHEYPLSIVRMDGASVSVDGSAGRPFQGSFHETFWSIPKEQRQVTAKDFADQAAVFDAVGRPTVEHALAGYHSCIFAYGQTGSGKTHTMLGSLDDPGVAPSVVDELFAGIEQRRELRESQQKAGRFRHTVEISFFEIYNERVKDLFCDDSACSPRAASRRLRAAPSSRRGSTAKRRWVPANATPESAKPASSVVVAAPPPLPVLPPAGQSPASGKSPRSDASQTPSPPSPHGQPFSWTGTGKAADPQSWHSLSTGAASPPGAGSPSKGSLQRRKPPALFTPGNAALGDDSPTTPRSVEPADLKGSISSTVDRSIDGAGKLVLSVCESVITSGTRPAPPNLSLGTSTSAAAAAAAASPRRIMSGTMSPRRHTASSPRNASPRSKSRSTLGRRASFLGRDDDYKELKVRNSPQHGTFIEGLVRLGEKDGFADAESVKRQMRFGMRHRATAETAMNSTSSRSHAIFQLCIKSRNSATGVQRYAHINLVDLAGSERISDSKSEGDRFTEATRINLSLGTLRRVIDALVENAKKKKGQPLNVPPYRESLLTWILSDSLGGNSRTVMLATVSPSEMNREDSINTLYYAHQAKAIVNTVYVTEQKTDQVMSLMLRELEDMKERLAQEEAKGATAELNALKEDVAARESEWRRATFDVRHAEEANLQQESMLLEAQQRDRQLDSQVKELQGLGVEDLHRGEQQGVVEREREVMQARSKIEESQRRIAEKELARSVEQAHAEAHWAAAQGAADRERAYRKEIVSVKRKKFALAFDLAFKQTKTSGSRECLEAELRVVRERSARAAMEHTGQVEELRAVHAEVDSRRRVIDVTETELAAVDERRGEQERRLHCEVRDLRTARMRLDADAAARRAEAQRLIAAVEQHRARSAEVRPAREERLRLVRSRQASVQDEAAQKVALVAQLRQQERELCEQAELLSSDNAELLLQTGEMRDRAAEMRRACEAMRADNPSLGVQAAEDAERARRYYSQLSRLHGQSLMGRENVAAVRTTHGDLKEYVSARFFPTATLRPPAEEERQRPARAASASPPRGAPTSPGSPPPLRRPLPRPGAVGARNGSPPSPGSRRRYSFEKSDSFQRQTQRKPHSTLRAS